MGAQCLRPSIPFSHTAETSTFALCSEGRGGFHSELVCGNSCHRQQQRLIPSLLVMSGQRLTPIQLNTDLELVGWGQTQDSVCPMVILSRPLIYEVCVVPNAFLITLL